MRRRSRVVVKFPMQKNIEDVLIREETFIIEGVPGEHTILHSNGVALGVGNRVVETTAGTIPWGRVVTVVKREGQAIKKGDTLYRVWNGHLTKVKFIEEQIAPGASIPTWIVQGDSGKAQVSREYYQRTERAAWEMYLQEWIKAEPGRRQAIDHAIRGLQEAWNEIAKVTDILKNLKD